MLLLWTRCALLGCTFIISAITAILLIALNAPINTILSNAIWIWSWDWDIQLVEIIAVVALLVYRARRPDAFHAHLRRNRCLLIGVHTMVVTWLIIVMAVVAASALSSHTLWTWRALFLATLVRWVCTLSMIIFTCRSCHVASIAAPAPPWTLVSKAALGPNASCAICIETYQARDRICVVHCASIVPHHFHHDCIIPWFQQHPECPLCRGVVVHVV